VSYGDVRISEAPIGSSMPHSQLRDLGRPARGWILVALAAGLRVVDGAEAVIHCFGFIEFLFVGLVGGIVNHAVTLVVEACGGLRRGWRIGSEGQGDTDNCRGDEGPHGFSPSASESTVREPRLVHGRHIGGGQEPKVGAARLVDHQASSAAGTPRAVMLLSAWAMPRSRWCGFHAKCSYRARRASAARQCAPLCSAGDGCTFPAVAALARATAWS